MNPSENQQVIIYIICLLGVLLYVFIFVCSISVSCFCPCGQTNGYTVYDSWFSDCLRSATSALHASEGMPSSGQVLATVVPSLVKNHNALDPGYHFPSTNQS